MPLWGLTALQTEPNSSCEQADATESKTEKTVFSTGEIRKFRPKTQFLKVYGHTYCFLTSCYEKRCYKMLFYFSNACCLCWNGNTWRKSLCRQAVGSPAPTAPHPIPAQPSGCSRGEVCSSCSRTPALPSALFGLLLLWGRKSQTCFGPKTSKMMSWIPLFLVLSICLLVHPCLTKTLIWNRVSSHTKDYFFFFFAAGLKAQRGKLS